MCRVSIHVIDAIVTRLTRTGLRRCGKAWTGVACTMVYFFVSWQHGFVAGPEAMDIDFLHLASPFPFVAFHIAAHWRPLAFTSILGRTDTRAVPAEECIQIMCAVDTYPSPCLCDWSLCLGDDPK